MARQPTMFFDEDERTPALEAAALRQFQRLSKADWFELYCDLYRMSFDEGASHSAIIEAVYQRITELRKLRAEGKR